MQVWCLVSCVCFCFVLRSVIVDCWLVCDNKVVYCLDGYLLFV